jgi:sterol desaturase/sphingolipid hydroxylase (fatty acid hydroxylase superfamily)
MKVHFFTFIMWEFYKVANSFDAHSAYVLPWFPTRLIPFHYDSSYHEFHHSRNIGNFSTSFYLYELIFGFNKLFFDMKLGKQKQSVKAQSVKAQ